MLLLALHGIALSTIPVVTDQMRSVFALSDAAIGFHVGLAFLFAVVSIPSGWPPRAWVGAYSQSVWGSQWPAL